MALKNSRSNNSVRVGVIGVGIGQAHINGYRKAQGAEIVALCDMNEERARQVARNCEIEDVQIFTDYRAMLDNCELDAVSVCLPNSLHRPVAVDCLNAGRHVICEKPLALNAREAQKIADAAEKNNRKCMVAQVKRFSAEAQFLKRAFESGELSDAYYAKAVWLRKRGIPGYGGWFTTKALSGGGPLIDIGVHLLDAAWWLCGCPKPIAASGATYAEFGPHGKGLGGWGLRDRTAKEKPTFDVEDLAVGLIRFDNGLTINLEVSWALNNERENQGVQIFGRDSGCSWGDSVSLFRDVDEIPTVATVALPKTDAWQNEMQHFIDCIINDTKPDPDATQGVTMMKMLDAIYKSAESGKEVVIR